MRNLSPAKRWRLGLEVMGAGAAASGIALAVHSDLIAAITGGATLVVMAIVLVPAAYQLWRDRQHANFRRTTQDAAAYLEWEHAVLARLYPTAVFRLCDREYVARIEPAKHVIEHSGKHALRFPELVRLTQPVVECEAKYSNAAKSYLSYATCDDVQIIKFPDRLGYVPISWNGESGGPLIDLGVTRFYDTVATGIDLHRELYDQYVRGIAPAEAKAAHRERLGLLSPTIPISKPGFRPVLSVQALTVVVEEGVPQVLIMQRSNNVAFRQGWWQLPPSGAMEVFGTVAEDDEDELAKHADPGASLRREFVEELFGVDEWQAAAVETFENLEVSADGRKLSDAFVSGAAKAIFMGVVADAVGLRGELCFLIVARDPGWEFKKGVEAKSTIMRKTFRELAHRLSRPSEKINPTSAALLRLAIDGGHLAREGLISMEEAIALFGPPK